MTFSFRHRPVLTGAALALACSLTPLAARQAADKADYDALMDRAAYEAFLATQ